MRGEEVNWIKIEERMPTKEERDGNTIAWWHQDECFEWGMGKRLGDFNNGPAYELAEAINDLFEKVRRIDDHEEIRRFNPENKWGSVETALVFLGRLAVACAKAPNAIIGVS